MRAAAEFAWLVLQTWATWLTGSVVALILVLIDKLTNWRVPKRVYVVVAVATLLVSFFQVWQGERTKLITAEEQVKELQAKLDAKPRPADLRFYCGDSEIGADGKKEFTLPLVSRLGIIAESSIYGPNIWIVNVGGSDAKDIHGQTYISERGLYHLQQNPGDNEYPMMTGWQIPVLHAMEGQPAGVFWAASAKPIKIFRSKLEAHYDGPTVVAIFTVRLFPISGPNYPASASPCARPSFLRLPSSVPHPHR